MCIEVLHEGPFTPANNPGGRDATANLEGLKGPDLDGKRGQNTSGSQSANWPKNQGFGGSEAQPNDPADESLCTCPR